MGTFLDIFRGNPKPVNNEITRTRREAFVRGAMQGIFGRKSLDNPIVNDLATDIAVLGFSPGSLGTPVTQVNTLQLNLRYYLVSNFRQMLSEAYVEKGLIKTVVDVPVNDAFRGGIDISSKELDGDDIMLLKTTMKNQGDLVKCAQGNKWRRLFGGGGLVLITDQDPRKPFKIKSLKKGEKVVWRPVDMWELFYALMNTEDYSVMIDEGIDTAIEYFDYYGHELHESRVLKMKGLEAPSLIRPRMRGWGVSVVESLIDSLNQYLKSMNLVFEVLDEFKVDVYKIQNFSSTLLDPTGAQLVQQRLQMANQMKNYFNALTMDTEDDFIQKELSFAGLAETMVGIRLQVASDVRMPLTKLFGISSQGFNSGEDDIENYNAMIESDIRTPTEPDVIFMTQVRCQQLFGFVPEDLQTTWKPLRVLSTIDEETVKTQRYNRLKSTVDGGLCTVKEFKDGCNKDQLLSVQIDPDVEKIDDVSQEGEDEGKVPAVPKTEGAKKSKLGAKPAKEAKS